MSSEIMFFEYNKPKLKSGNYTIKVTQTIQNGKPEINQTFDSEFNFSVIGERFSLDPSAIHAVFPPHGSSGDHSNVLPHIAFKRSTFPWERLAAQDDNDSTPWLMLLLFDEEEIKNKGIIQQFTTLEKKPEILTRNPLEKGQSDSDKVSIIDVKKRLLDSIMPSYDELKLLAHVRRRLDTGGKIEMEIAVVVGNRLPKLNSSSTVHLVSVERMFDGKKTFIYNTSNEDAYVSFISLKSWSFYCTESRGETFDGLVDKLDKGMLRYPLKKEELIDKYLARGYIPLPHFLRNGDSTYSWYHSPLTTQAVDKKFVQGGNLPECSDALIRYHTGIHMFDMAYAAAFELGRVLALECSEFTKTLYKLKYWYKTVILKSKADDQSKMILSKSKQQGYIFSNASKTVLKYLCNEKVFEFAEKLANELRLKAKGLKVDYITLEESELKAKIKEANLENHESSIFKYTGASRQYEVQFLVTILEWIDEIARFTHIPFNYLVPDEKMLPADSIRFFLIDLYWVECLLIGAFSLGTPLSQLEDKDNDGVDLSFERYVIELIKPFLCAKSGILLRSPLVSGFPDILLEAFSGEIALKNLRKERIAPDTLFCLFEGNLNSIDLYLKSEGMHFGFEKNVGDNKTRGVFKEIDEVENIVNKDRMYFDFKSEPEKRVVRINDIAQKLKSKLNTASINSAYYGKYMVERNEKHKFKVGD